MRQAELLAALRKQGRTDEDCKEVLQALASGLPRHDAVADIISKAADEIADYIEGQRLVAEMRADDLDNERYRHLDRGECDAGTQRLCGFLMGAV